MKLKKRLNDEVKEEKEELDEINLDELLAELELDEERSYRR